MFYMRGRRRRKEKHWFTQYGPTNRSEVASRSRNFLLEEDKNQLLDISFLVQVKEAVGTETEAILL